MEQVIDRTKVLFSDAAAGAYEKMVDILPEALLAILTVRVGWLIASVMYSICVRVMAFFAVDKLMAKTPLDRMLKNIGVNKHASEILGLLVFWMTILVTLVFAAEILNLPQVSSALAVVTAYIPQMIAAFLILIFGMLFAKFLQTIISQSLTQLQLGYEQTIGRVVQGIILIFVVLVAIEQLGLDLSFLTTNVILIVAAFLLILGLSIVVGARTILENVLACQQLQRVLTEGQKVEIGELRGTVRSFTVSGVIIESEKGDTIVPATNFFTQTYTIIR